MVREGEDREEIMKVRKMGEGRRERGRAENRKGGREEGMEGEMEEKRKRGRKGR